MGAALDDLARRWLAAKGAEKAAQDARLAVEQEICTAVGLKPEGSTTEKTDNFKLTTTGKVTRSVDVDELVKVAPELPAPIVDRLIRHKADVNLAELRYVQEHEPALYSKYIARFVTSKPAKPAVSVEPIGK